MRSEVAANGEATGLLGHLRVLDWTSSTAAYCAKLFADLGAEVIRVEAPSGAGTCPGHTADSARRRSTFFTDLYANANKSIVVLDLERASDRKRFKALATASDLLLEDQPVGPPAWDWPMGISSAITPDSSRLRSRGSDSRAPGVDSDPTTWSRARWAGR